VNDWSKTVSKLKAKYPDTQIIIPGHGKSGGTALLDYTIKLFEQK
jgi:metallo-beta-lactamase class B